MSIVRFILFPAFTALFAGCATMALSQVGARVERVSGYESAYQRDDTLLIFYRAEVWSGQAEAGPPLDANAARWADIDLTEVRREPGHYLDVRRMFRTHRTERPLPDAQ